MPALWYLTPKITIDLASTPMTDWPKDALELALFLIQDRPGRYRKDLFVRELIAYQVVKLATIKSDLEQL